VAGLQRRLERGEHALGLCRVVGRVVAHVDVDGHESGFGPRMDRQVRFGQQDRAGDTLGLELKEAVADDRETGIIDGSATKVAQCVRLRQQRFVGRATVPLAQQMDSFHRVTLQELLPLGRLPDPGATVADLFAHDGRRAPVGMFDTAPALFARESGNTKLWHNNGAFAGTINPFAPSFPCMAHP